jgi:hypothetical protein
MENELQLSRRRNFLYYRISEFSADNWATGAPNAALKETAPELNSSSTPRTRVNRL